MAFILCAILVLSTLFFGAVALIDEMGQQGMSNTAHILDVKILRDVSIILLPLSCILGYVINVADNVRFSPNVPKIQEKQYQKLSADFEKLGDNNND